MSADNTNRVAERRGFLKALGLSAGVAAAAGAAPAEAQTAAPAKENAQGRTAARYQPNSAHVQAFYRSNRGS